MILCHIFIVGKFILVFYKEIKAYGMCKMQFFFRKVGPGLFSWPYR